MLLCQFIKSSSVDEYSFYRSYSDYTNNGHHINAFEKSLDFTITDDELLAISLNQCAFFQQLKSKKIINNLENDGNKWIITMRDYEKFMYLKTVNAAIDYKTISLEMELIWRIHLLNPVKYNNDCLTCFNEIIDHKINDVTAFQIHNHTEWNLYFEKYKHLFVNNNDNEDQSLLNNAHNTFYLAILRQLIFIKKVNNLSQTLYINTSTIRRFKQFLYLIYLRENDRYNNNFLIIPPFDVDIIWHSYQLCPIQYNTLSKSVLGDNNDTCVINHNDNISTSNMKTYQLKTLLFWRRIFGENDNYFNDMKTQYNNNYIKQHNIIFILFILISLVFTFQLLMTHLYSINIHNIGYKKKNCAYTINYYDNNVTLNLEKNLINFNVSILYNFNSRWCVNSKGFKSIAYVISDGNDITNIKYFANNEVYSYKLWTQSNWNDIGYYFTKGWFTSDTSHLVQFEYGLRFDYLCKLDHNPNNFQLPLPWVNKWKYPGNVKKIGVNLYCNQSIFNKTIFTTNWITTKNIATNTSIYDMSNNYSLCHQLEINHVPGNDLIIYGDNTAQNMFNKSHSINKTCTTLNKSISKAEEEEIGWITAGIYFVLIAGIIIIRIALGPGGSSGSRSHYHSSGGGGSGGGGCGG